MHFQSFHDQTYFAGNQTYQDTLLVGNAVYMNSTNCQTGIRNAFVCSNSAQQWPASMQPLSISVPGARVGHRVSYQPDLYQACSLKKSQRIIIDVCVRLLNGICTNGSGMQATSSDELLGQAVINILRASATSYSALLICIIYLIRFKNAAKEGEMQIYGFNDPIILFATALVLSLKFVTDKHISNNSWECICGLVDKIPLEMFNLAECWFLQMIRYDLYVEPQLINHLADMIIGKQMLHL